MNEKTLITAVILILSIILVGLVTYLYWKYRFTEVKSKTIGTLTININGDGPKELFEIVFEEDPMDLEDGGLAVFTVRRR